MNSALVVGLLCWMLTGFGLCLAGLVWLWRWSMTFDEKVDALAAGLAELRAQAQQNTADVAALQTAGKAQEEAVAAVQARADEFDAKLNRLVEKLGAVLVPPQEVAFGMSARGKGNARRGSTRKKS